MAGPGDGDIRVLKIESQDKNKGAIELLKRALDESEELVTLTAKLRRQCVEALEAEGFTRAEAVRMVTMSFLGKGFQPLIM